MEEAENALEGDLKRVWVDPYIRIRDGLQEHVRGHWRRWPNRRRSATLIPFPHPSDA